jgi:acetyltransferase-like isoleucine patch superfamily enzyme
MDSRPEWHHLPANPYNPHAWILGDPDIGPDVWIGAFTVIDGSGGLAIGSGTHVSSGAQIYTHSTVSRALSGGRSPIDRRATRIGDECHVGAGAIVLMGCQIGSHCVIGAGSVVLEGTTADAYSLIVGNPARVIAEGARHLVGDDGPSEDR